MLHLQRRWMPQGETQKGDLNMDDNSERESDTPMEENSRKGKKVKGKTMAAKTWERNYHVEMRFTVDSPVVKLKTMRKLSKHWRDWRSHLKATFFSPGNRKASMRLLNDELVDKDQWAAFVRLCDSEHAMKEAATNRDNRSKQKIGHTLGTKSMSKKKTEMEPHSCHPN